MLRTAVRNLAAAIIVLALPAGTALSQDVWTGPPVTFSKAPFADWTLPENQDRITDNVWLTRADLMGIFNIAVDSSYMGPSPTDTEWATGSAEDYESLDFQIWVDWAESFPPGTVGVDAVVHLITDDIYIDIRFLEWGVGFSGGAVAWERATPGSDSDDDGIEDGSDNCTLVANPDQRDTNGDGFGNACDPDLNDDLEVNFQDLALFQLVIFSDDADSDYNGDGAVNFIDLGVMKSLFFQSPGPSGIAP